MKYFSNFVDHLYQSSGKNDVLVYVFSTEILTIFDQIDFFHQNLTSLLN